MPLMPATLNEVVRMKNVRIAVLGSGSVGLALAATYVLSGANVTVFARASADEPQGFAICRHRCPCQR